VMADRAAGRCAQLAMACHVASDATDDGSLDTSFCLRDARGDESNGDTDNSDYRLHDKLRLLIRQLNRQTNRQFLNFVQMEIEGNWHLARFVIPHRCFQTRKITMKTERRETGTLIGSDKVEGTAVYGADNQKIGSIERVMIDKVSGQVSYAVLGFGGFLGIGDDHYPLPWQSLKYDTGLGGYRSNLTAERLQGAPKYGNDNDWNWEDPGRARTVNNYYSGF
jgi:hypothetical protein